MEFTEGWRSKKPLNPQLGWGKGVWIFHGAYFYSWLYGAYVNPSICFCTILYSLLREQKILATYEGNHFLLLQTVIIFLLNNVCCTCKLTILEIAEYFCKKRFTDAISALSAHINESNPSPVQSLFANQAPNGSGILIISEFFLLITLHRDSYRYNENKVCNHIQNIDVLIFLCHFNLILLLLVKKIFFFKYNIIVLVTQVAFDICSPSVLCMLDFHFENQWFPYVVNDMFGEWFKL